MKNWLQAKKASRRLACNHLGKPNKGGVNWSGGNGCLYLAALTQTPHTPASVIPHTAVLSMFASRFACVFRSFSLLVRTTYANLMPCTNVLIYIHSLCVNQLANLTMTFAIRPLRYTAPSQVQCRLLASMASCCFLCSCSSIFLFIVCLAEVFVIGIHIKLCASMCVISYVAALSTACQG